MTFKVEVKVITPKQKITDLYNQYIYQSTLSEKDEKSRELADKHQRELEKELGRILGFRNVGVANKTLIPDYIVNLSKTDIELLQDEETAEAKVLATNIGSEHNTTIGQINLTEGISKEESTKLRSKGAKDTGDSSIRKDTKPGFLHRIANKLNQSHTSYVFDTLFRRNQSLKKRFYGKARNLILFQQIGNKIHSMTLQTPYNKFTSQFFSAKLYPKKDTVLVSIKSATEKKIKSAVSKAGFSFITNELKQRSKRPIKKVTTVRRKIRGQEKGFSVKVTLPTGGSIPTAKIHVKAPAIKEKPDDNVTRGRFISAVHLTTILQRKVYKVSPKGPIGGRQTHPTKLTMRSLRFLQSIKITYINYRTSLAKYWYLPLYKWHKRYDRDPDIVIARSLREELRKLYGRKFNVISEA